MNKVNKHGLSRYIEEPIKREIRRRCGLGCVVCGFPVITYHHFFPTFEKAATHDPDGITLLCYTCHQKTFGNNPPFDADFINKKNSNPKCKTTGEIKSKFYIGFEPVNFNLGPIILTKTLNILKYHNEVLIGFSKNDDHSAPFVLNAKLFDRTGKKFLEITNNEWVAGIEQFDIQIKGGILKIISRPHSVLLQLRHVAEKVISIDKLDLSYQGYRLEISKNELIASHVLEGQRWIGGKVTLINGCIQLQPFSIEHDHFTK